MSGFLGEITNSRSGGYRLHQRYPLGAKIQSAEYMWTGTGGYPPNEKNFLYNSGTAQNGLEMKVKSLNPKVSVKLSSTVVGFDNTGTADTHDLGLSVKYGTASNAINTHFGASHSHRFDGANAAHFDASGTSVNYLAQDGHLVQAPDNTWFGAELFYELAMAISVTPGQTLYWQIAIHTGAGAIYWNRAEAAGDDQLGHTWFQINEYKSAA